MTRFLSLVALLQLVCLTALPGRQMDIVPYAVDNGLSNNTVRCIRQDQLGFIWIATADGLNRFDGRRFRVYNSANADYHGLESTSVFALLPDKAGSLWAGTEDGLYRFDRRLDRFHRFAVRTAYHVEVTGRVTCLFENSDGQIWIGTEDQGLFVYDPGRSTLVQHTSFESAVSAITSASGCRVIAGAEHGTISVFDSTARLLTEIPDGVWDGDPVGLGLRCLFYKNNSLWCGLANRGLHEISLQGTRAGVGTDAFDLPVLSMLPLSEDELLIGSDNGLHVFDPGKPRVSKVYATGNSDRQFNYVINDLFEDNEGGIWISTQHHGAGYIKRQLKPLEAGTADRMAWDKNIVTCFAEDANGKVWIGTDDAGILALCGDGEPDRNPLRLVEREQAELRSIRSLLIDNGHIWVGTANNGVYRFDSATHRYTNYRYDSHRHNTVPDNGIDALFRDRDGTVYVGTKWGFAAYDPHSDTFHRINLGSNALRIAGFTRGVDCIWLASPTAGILKFNPVEYTLTAVPFLPEESPTRQPAGICVFMDRDGAVWAGTDAGLFLLDESGTGFEQVEDREAMFSGNYIASLQEDADGKLWISTHSGLFQFDRATRRVIYHLLSGDGLQSNQFNDRASLLRSGGQLLFGGINGFDMFDGADFQGNGFIPQTYITGLYVNDKQTEVRRDRKDRSPLRTGLQDAGSVKLGYRQNTVGFTFAALSYQSPAKNRYQYMMAGHDRQWSYTDQDHVSYGNLPPGKYTFQVRGTNDDGQWSARAATLSVRVLKPPYRSNAALAGYVVLLLAAGFTIYRTQYKRNLKKLREYQREQQEKAYLSKIEFFTNLAHEIRTPLSLIKVPLESILRSGETFSERTGNYLDIMDRNAAALLDMVNQLLDLRRNEDDAYRTVPVMNDISAIVNDVCDRFLPVLEVSGIELDRDIAANVRYAVDREAFGKVVNNILSNASKYAAGRIDVRLRDNGDSFTVSIRNDGEGIKSGDEERIFETFFQSPGSKSGTGIGLPLARMLVERHSGNIGFENLPGGGVEFRVTIPRLEPQAVEAPPLSESILPAGPAALPPIVRDADVTDGRQVRVLIVEDNRELLQLMATLLESHFTVITATNGREAVETIEREYCDVVVSDVMMPEMDGYELCGYIKSDVRYCHLPVIQLSARTAMEYKVKGLEYGADVYIEKPFDAHYLVAQINSVIANRERLRESLRKSPLDRQRQPGVSGRDAAFIEKLNGYIEERLLDENFYIEELTEKMLMSRSNFYRKIKALFGISPNDYLKNYRLKKATAMLEDPTILLKEIHFHAGFKTPNYFSSCFKKEFGITPKQYRDKFLQGNTGNG